MADSASEMESDTSSVDGGNVGKTVSPESVEQLEKRVESLKQENRVLKIELDTFKQRCRNLQEANQELRRASVTIQAKAEQEEEFISNKLFKKIQSLQKEKETLAMNYEQEEEFLTNDLSRKLLQLRQEKVELEQTLEKEQEYQVKKLMKKIEKLEAETMSKQENLERLRHEKVELENALEQEQEALVNRLWKRMDKLETEKRMLQEKLDQPVTSPPPSPREEINNGDVAGKLSEHIQHLRNEVRQLRGSLRAAQTEHEEKMAQYQQEERHIREENLRLQRKLQLEVDRREQLCRHLSESESSLEMEDERHFHEMSKSLPRNEFILGQPGQASLPGPTPGVRSRTVSSPIPMSPGGTTRALSPAHPFGSPATAFSPPSPMRCGASLPYTNPGLLPGTSPPTFSHMTSARKSLDHEPNFPRPRTSPNTEKFLKPSNPPPSPGSDKSSPHHTSS